MTKHLGRLCLPKTIARQCLGTALRAARARSTFQGISQWHGKQAPDRVVLDSFDQARQQRLAERPGRAASCTKHPVGRPQPVDSQSIKAVLDRRVARRDRQRASASQRALCQRRDSGSCGKLGVSSLAITTNTRSIAAHSSKGLKRVTDHRLTRESRDIAWRVADRRANRFQQQGSRRSSRLQIQESILAAICGKARRM